MTLTRPRTSYTATTIHPPTGNTMYKAFSLIGYIGTYATNIDAWLAIRKVNTIVDQIPD